MYSLSGNSRILSLGVLKRSFFYFISGTLLLVPLLTYAQEMSNPINQPITFVIDEDFDQQMPKKFRTSQDPFVEHKAPTPTRKGLNDLKIAGSGQFSERTLKQALKSLGSKVWIMDLRRETHGFIDGNPVSWYGTKNRTNVGLDNVNILKKEEKLLKDIAQQTSMLVNKIVEKEEGTILETKRYIIEVENVKTERQLANDLGLGYSRLGVFDHEHPDDEVVDEFLDLIKQIPPDTVLYFHCRGGRGRTTLFMSMYDMIHNAKQVSLEDIIRRQALLGGIDLASKDVASWKAQAALARKNFAMNFYKYAKDPKGYPKQSWRQWKKRHSYI